MPYATAADLEARLSVAQVEKIAGAAQGEPAYDAAVTRVLERASALIDAHARGRYAVPLEPSEQLEQLAVDIAAYYLERTRNVVREVDKEAYEEAVKFLEKLSAGKVGLDQPAGEDAQSAAAAGAPERREDSEYVFSKTNTEGF